MLPLDLSSSAGTVGYALLFGAIGMAFGAALETAGFGDSRKLAAQFYLREMTVLKVMFTAIVVAAVLLALASAFELLDFSRVWINPTYLPSQVVGGLIMGVGFIVGGFCPGTSLVAAATLKLDGLFFVLGGLFGVFTFGETVSHFESFFLSSPLGRFTLPDWLGLPTGVVVLLVALMALSMFWAGEILERRFGQRQPWSEITFRPRSLPKLLGACALVLACGVLVFRGQPTPEQRWGWIAAKGDAEVRERAIFVHPAEVVALRQDTSAQVGVLDVRDEHDFNLFHIAGSQRIAPGELYRTGFVQQLLDRPANAATFLVSNGEGPALHAWKLLRAQGVLNIYVIEGGINRWLQLYPLPDCVAQRLAGVPPQGDLPAYRFGYATGDSLPSARPELPARMPALPCGAAAPILAAGAGRSAPVAPWPAYEYTKKVKLQTRKVVRGGCG